MHCDGWTTRWSWCALTTLQLWRRCYLLFKNGIFLCTVKDGLFVEVGVRSQLQLRRRCYLLFKNGMFLFTVKDGLLFEVDVRSQLYNCEEDGVFCIKMACYVHCVGWTTRWSWCALTTTQLCRRWYLLFKNGMFLCTVKDGLLVEVGVCSQLQLWRRCYLLFKNGMFLYTV
jgi:hypothetical protein